MSNYRFALDPKNILPAAGGFLLGDWAREGLNKVKEEMSNIAGEGVDKEHTQYFEVVNAVEGLLQCLQTVGVSSIDYQTLLNSLWDSALSYDDIKNSGIIDSMCKVITMGSIDSGNGTPEQTASLVVNFVKNSMQKRMDINLTKNQLESIYNYYQNIRKLGSTSIDGLGLLKAFITDPARLDLIFALLAWNSGFDTSLLDSSTEISRIRSEMTGPDSPEFEKARKMKEEIIETQITQDKLDTAILELRRNVDIQRKNMIQWLNLQFADAAGTDLAKQIVSQLGPLINSISLVSAFAGNAYQFLAPNVKANSSRRIFKQSQQQQQQENQQNIQNTNLPNPQITNQQNTNLQNNQTTQVSQNDNELPKDHPVMVHFNRLQQALGPLKKEYENVKNEYNTIESQFQQEYNMYTKVLQNFTIDTICNLGKGESAPPMEMFSPDVVIALYTQITELHQKLESLFKQIMDIYDTIYKFLMANVNKYQAEKGGIQLKVLTNSEETRNTINEHRKFIMNILKKEKTLYFFESAIPVLNYIFTQSYHFCTIKEEYNLATRLPGHAGLTAAYNSYKEKLSQLYGIVSQGGLAIQNMALEAKNKEVMSTANIILNSLKFSLDEIKRESTRIAFDTAQNMGANIAKLT